MPRSIAAYVAGFAFAVSSGGWNATLAAQGSLPPVPSAADDALNFRFETASILTSSRPAGWNVNGQGYDFALDSVAPHGGRSSPRIRASGPLTARSFGVASPSTLPGPEVAGRVVRLRGWIRTDGVTTGYAGLWMRADAEPGRMLTLDNMSGRGVTGTTGWTPVEITMNVPREATVLIVGALHPGDGAAWFDDLSLDVDGAPYVHPTWTPTADQQSWVRAHAIRLAGADPRAPLDDLRSLGEFVGDARLVALGEGTHGTSEYFRTKHRLTEYLAREKGFTVFAIEASMPEARRVNEYVLTGRGDPRAALAGMYFWTWNTQEVLDLIEWMRAYNASGRGRMEFWGFDLQTPELAMDSVRAFVARADTAYRPTLDSAYGGIAAARAAQRAAPNGLADVGPWRAGAARVLAHLQEARDGYVRAGRDTLDVAWAIQYARIVLQGANAAAGTTSRDSSMAANVAWIMDHQPPGTRAVLWAHNGHVSRNAGWMGAHLATRYGAALRVVGFAMGDGSYTAVGPRGLAAYPAIAPPAGSVEAVLRTAGVPAFALDLRSAAADANGAWLAEPHLFRSIGAVAMDAGFYATPVARHFDLLVYFDHTTPSASLGYGTRPAP